MIGLNFIAAHGWYVLLSQIMVPPRPLSCYCLSGSGVHRIRRWADGDFVPTQDYFLLTLISGLLRPHFWGKTLWFLIVTYLSRIFWFALRFSLWAVLSLDFIYSVLFFHNLGSQVIQGWCHSLNIWGLFCGHEKGLRIGSRVLRQQGSWLFNNLLALFELDLTLRCLKLVWTRRLLAYICLLLRFKF